MLALLNAIDGNVLAAIISSAVVVFVGLLAVAVRLGKLEQRVNDLHGKVEHVDHCLDEFKRFFMEQDRNQRRSALRGGRLTYEPRRRED